MKEENSLSVKFGEKIGRGAYGIVYSVTSGETEKRKLALKRNIVDSETFGIGSIKEADALKRLAGHPHITNVTRIIYDSELTFPKENLSRLFSPGMQNDKVHFVFDKENTSLHNATKRRKLEPRAIKIIAAQILLATEWIHSRGIVHRDLKPANILYNGSSSYPHIRLCDFGLCGMLEGAGVSTPGLVTSWYRPPEICLAANTYSEKIDIWSIGAILFELLSGTALLYNRNDSNGDILVGIFARLPSLASKTAIESMSGSEMSAKELKSIFARVPRRAKTLILDESLTPARRSELLKSSIRESAGLSASEVQAFNEEDGGSLVDFCDLIGGMLEFQPENRPSSKQALSHVFFQWLRTFIETTRKTYPPVGLTLPVLDFVFCEEREIAYSLLVACYNSRSRIPWYDHRIIFHAADIFDQYLVHRQTDPQSRQGLAKTERETYVRVYVCLYLFHKYFLSLEEPDTWKEFAPLGFSDPNTMKEAEAFEMHIVKNVCDCAVYRDTLFEVVSYKDGRIRETSVRKCLSVLSRLTYGVWKEGGSVRALYRDVVDV
jgi:serine/threonine protein kinase